MVRMARCQSQVYTHDFLFRLICFGVRMTLLLFIALICIHCINGSILDLVQLHEFLLLLISMWSLSHKTYIFDNIAIKIALTPFNRIWEHYCAHLGILLGLSNPKICLLIVFTVILDMWAIFLSQPNSSTCRDSVQLCDFECFGACVCASFALIEIIIA